MSSLVIDPQEMQTYCESLGIDIMGVAPVEAMGEGWFKAHADITKEWIQEGKHANMEWFANKLEERCVPELLLPGVSHAVVLWIHYRFERPPRPQYTTAQVARYAWGRDYHNILRKIIRKLSKWIQERVPNANLHGSVDTSPVLERAYAERASVGWIGKSTMLIHPRLGTYGSLAVLFSTVDLPFAKHAHPDRCGTCTACLDICPTKALDGNSLDARLCISYWTIEHRGLIPKAMRTELSDWVFGCDLCQVVCPWNNKAGYATSSAKELWQPQSHHIWPNLKDWLQMSDDALNQSLLGSPLRRAFPYGLKRNALLMLAMQHTIKLWPEILFQLFHSNDAVRGTAAWTLSQYFTAHHKHKPNAIFDWSSVSKIDYIIILLAMEYLSSMLMKHRDETQHPQLEFTIFHFSYSSNHINHRLEIYSQAHKQESAQVYLLRIKIDLVHRLLDLLNALLKIERVLEIQQEIQDAINTLMIYLASDEVE